MKNVNINYGVGFGTLIAAGISYLKWHSLGWMILHGFLGWFYIIYYAIRYGGVI